LQAICIMAGDHRQRQLTWERTQAADSAPLPSLVVCPPTLVAHWHFEVQKFCRPEDFRCVMYAGTPAERAAIRGRLGSVHCIVLSYDVLRNDIEVLEPLTFNYCILDEGHVIRNAKTKTTQAVKRVQANHRLVLSGTHIQATNSPHRFDSHAGFVRLLFRWRFRDVELGAGAVVVV
jgi:TATA-binding protein-associated factor